MAPLPDGQVLRLRGGALTTSPARTLLDCLRALPGRDALAMLDVALRRKMVSQDQLLATLQFEAGWPGITRSRTVLALGEDRRESPLESWSAWAFATMDVPAPQWQVEIRTTVGRRLARVDCWWPGVAGEADGRSKYALAAAERGGADRQTLFDVLQAERAREQRLRDAGADVVRWSAADVLHVPRTRDLVLRIHATLTLAQQSDRFIGIAAPTMLP